MCNKNHLSIEGCQLSQQAIEFIKGGQDENSAGLKTIKDNLTELLVDVIQDGTDNERNKFISVLADTIQLIHSLQTE